MEANALAKASRARLRDRLLPLAALCVGAADDERNALGLKAGKLIWTESRLA
jgi:hypothetical protein